MTTRTAHTNPIRRLAHSQSPLAITLELLFALLLVAAFWLSRSPGFWTGEGTGLVPALPPAALQPQIPPPPSLPHLLGFDPAGKECRELIANGSFEQVGVWRLPLASRPATYTDERASEGALSLRLGVTDTDQPAYGESRATQTVDLPADAQSIVLLADIWRTAQGEGGSRQSLRVQVGEESHTLFDERLHLPDWQTVAYDLSLLAGSRAQLAFAVHNSGGPDRAAMGVDNVHLYACRQPDQLTESAVTTESSPALSLLMPLIALLPQSDPPTVTATPTPTATSTTTLAAPAVCSELVANGDFETSGDWTIPNTPRPARFASAPVWTGSRSLGLGIPPGQANAYSDSTAYQWIHLPVDAAQITLRARLWRAGRSRGDFHYLWVAAEGKTTRIVQGLDDRQEWQEISYDLTRFRGKRLFLLLGTFNDGQGNVAAMYADGVSIRACDDGVLPTPTAVVPTATPTSTPTPSAIHQPPAAMTSPDFGVNAFLWWRADIADRDLMLMQEAGFRWVRQSFAWEDIESAQGRFAWEQADRVVGQVNDAGLSLLARLELSPRSADFWAGRPPQSNARFVEFVAAIAQRYNCTADAVGCIPAWQVGNEPNLAREWGGNRPDPAAYTALLGQVYAAIKAANPNAVVISAGMAPTGTNNALAMPDTRFYEEMYRAMGGNSDGYFDLLGVHAAGFAAPPETDPAAAAANPAYGGQRFFAFRHVEDIRALMEANGDGDKRIAVLEFGWTSDPVNADYYWFGAGAGIDEFVKADYLRRAYVYAAEKWQPWIGLMSALTMPNLDWLADGNPFDEEQYWWAILEPSRIDELRLRPAYVELCIYFRGLRGERCVYDPN